MKFFTVALSLIALSLQASSGAFALVGARDQFLQKLHHLNITTTTTSAADDTPPACLFHIVVQTGSMANAGTDARVSLRLGSADGTMVGVRDLETWGQMEPGHDYFEQGQRDLFGGLSPCMPTVPCTMLLSSDGSGDNPSWFVEWVSVIQVGGTDVSTLVKSHLFNVRQWLATDETPHKLYAEVDDCAKISAM